MNCRKVSVSPTSPTSFFPQQSAWCLVVNCIFFMQLRIKLHSSWDLKVHIGTVPCRRATRITWHFLAVRIWYLKGIPKTTKGAKWGKSFEERGFWECESMAGWGDYYHEIRWWDQNFHQTLELSVFVSFLQFFGKFMFGIAMIFFKGTSKKNRGRKDKYC